MDRPSFLQDFQQRVLEMLRASPAADVERNLKALMSQTFTKLELVNRDEFEVQVELLRALRSRVDALEARLGPSTGPSTGPLTDPPTGPSTGPSIDPLSDPSTPPSATPSTDRPFGSLPD